MADTIKLVSGDNYPLIRLTLTDDVTGLPVDLSAGTTAVTVKFRATGTTTVLSTLTCTKPGGGADGVVTFYFPTTELDVAAGLYEGEICIDFNGLLQTVYDKLRFKVREDF